MCACGRKNYVLIKLRGGWIEYRFIISLLVAALTFGGRSFAKMLEIWYFNTKCMQLSTIIFANTDKKLMPKKL